ncbi:MAG: hypothetical protein DYG89_01785 [Caldilinea sp. CFX5]|nr:hypothetical protein [Caldilinea sp. CFX5]
MNKQLSSTTFGIMLFVTLFAACAKNNASITVLPTADVRMFAKVAQPHATALPAQIVDRQMLAEYQATLLTYADPVVQTPHTIDSRVDQIADRQALAEYQAALSLGDSHSPVTK